MNYYNPVKESENQQCDHGHVHVDWRGAPWWEQVSELGYNRMPGASLGVADAARIRMIGRGAIGADGAAVEVGGGGEGGHQPRTVRLLPALAGPG